MKAREENSAISRALGRAEMLSQKDLVALVDRIEKSMPVENLGDVRYVEGVANELSASGRRFLVDSLKSQMETPPAAAE